MASTNGSKPTISPAGRIRELNAINDEIGDLLASAGKAVQALSGAAPEENDDQDEFQEGTSGEDEEAPNQRAFARHTKQYFITLQAICAKLNRQAYALEEAGIVAADAPILTLADASQQSKGPKGSRAPVSAEAERIKNGGLGNFDVGWLNSRGNKIGAEKEAEVLEKVRELAESVSKSQSGSS